MSNRYIAIGSLYSYSDLPLSRTRFLAILRCELQGQIAPHAIQNHTKCLPNSRSDGRCNIKICGRSSGFVLAW